MYVQHAPVPVQASLVSPDMFASNIIQLKDGGVALMNAKIIKRVSNALKLFVFIFLLIRSRFSLTFNCGKMPFSSCVSSSVPSL